MTLATKLRDSKAVCAGAGVVDLAVEKLREVPEQVTKLQGTARENAARLQGTARENAAKFQENVKDFQEKVDAKDIPGAAVAYMSHLGARMAEVYDGLAERGKTVVTRSEPEIAEIEKPRPAPKAAPTPSPAGKQGTSDKQSTAKKSGA